MESNILVCVSSVHLHCQVVGSLLGLWLPTGLLYMLTLPEYLMIFSFLVKVHAAIALFFVAFVFNSVYLFCPCYFYCLFVCTLSLF
jgi:hypothetical protein